RSSQTRASQKQLAITRPNFRRGSRRLLQAIHRQATDKVLEDRRMLEPGHPRAILRAHLARILHQAGADRCPGQRFVLARVEATTARGGGAASAAGVQIRWTTKNCPETWQVVRWRWCREEDPVLTYDSLRDAGIRLPLDASHHLCGFALSTIYPHDRRGI